MSNQPKSEHAPHRDKAEETAAENGAAAAQEAQETTPAGEEAGVSEEDVLLRLARENEEHKEQALRLAAEMENLRKRTARELVDARNYSIANFARDMLTVSDNLRRALEAVPADARERGESGLKTLIEGVEMTERAMLTALERHGVKQINPQGEKFDPHFHQAMFEVPDPDVPSNTVVQVAQSGYVIGERVLRPAMVGVSKGGPKAAAENANAEPKSPEIPANDDDAEPGPPNPYSEKDA